MPTKTKNIHRKNFPLKVVFSNTKIDDGLGTSKEEKESQPDFSLPENFGAFRLYQILAPTSKFDLKITKPQRKLTGC